MKVIEVTLTFSVPDEACDQDIKDWVEVELGGYNSMSQDNPCINRTEVLDAEWCHSYQYPDD